MESSVQDACGRLKSPQNMMFGAGSCNVDNDRLSLSRAGLILRIETTTDNNKFDPSGWDECDLPYPKT